MSFLKMDKRVRGSYTIEAALLFPMILTVIIIIIYLSFFLHDRCILGSAAYVSALRGSQAINQNDIYHMVEENSQKLIKGRMLATSEIDTKIQIEGKRISVEYEGVLKIPAGVLLCRYLWKTYDLKGVPVKAVGEAKVQDAVKFIRECRIMRGYSKSGN